MPERAGGADVCIQGMGLACALGIGVDASLANLRAGIVTTRPGSFDAVEMPDTFPIYALPGADELTNRSGTVALIDRVVRDAINGAQLTLDQCRTLPIFIGTSAFSLDAKSIEQQEPDSVSTVGVAPVLAYQQLVEILRQRFGMHGDCFAYQTACTSSANAVMSAARMIRRGRYSHALVLGVEIANAATMAGFSSLQLLSHTLRPFDRHRSGIVIGEGIGAVVLSRAASRDRGIFMCDGGANIDSYRVTTANPDGVNIAALQQTVLRRAGLNAADIRGIKAHGTGSQMNDACEAAVIRRTFENHPPVCALKPYIGHTLGACGVNELVLMAASLREGIFPATPGFETPDPELGVNPTTTGRTAYDGHYLLNYFGFGGHNTILVIEKRS